MNPMLWCQRDTETTDVTVDLLTSLVCRRNVDVENLTEAERLEDQSVDGILKKKKKKQDTRARTEFAWLRRWPSSIFCEHGD